MAKKFIELYNNDATQVGEFTITDKKIEIVIFEEGKNKEEVGVLEGKVDVNSAYKFLKDEGSTYFSKNAFDSAENFYDTLEVYVD